MLIWYFKTNFLQLWHAIFSTFNVLEENYNKKTDIFITIVHAP